MNRLRIYVEGGGEKKEQSVALRKGMEAFLRQWKDLGNQNKKWHLEVVPCGDRHKAYKRFMGARKHPETGEIILLLVDSEAPVKAPSKAEHLQNRLGDGWNLSGVPEDHIHLMAQTMETWIIADPEKLAEYYGKGFQVTKIPKSTNLEEEPKDDIAQKLAAATKNTTKREYHKLRHASEILKMIRPGTVRQRCPHAGHFFDSLDKVLNSPAAP